MGLDKHKKTPCGFCFVIYYTRQAAEDCVTFISGTKLDDRRVRCDYDWGFQDDRQFGRGRSGGQASDLTSYCSSSLMCPKLSNSMGKLPYSSWQLALGATVEELALAACPAVTHSIQIADCLRKVLDRVPGAFSGSNIIHLPTTAAFACVPQSPVATAP